MNDEIIHKIERIEEMLYILLTEEQKEKIKDFDIKYYEQKRKEVKKDMESTLMTSSYLVNSYNIPIKFL